MYHQYNPKDDTPETEVPDHRIEDEIFDGTVKLVVEVAGYVQLMISFMAELRRNPYFRLLRLENHPPRDVDIWMALRQPVQLIPMLVEMQEVSQVDELPSEGTQRPGDERTLRLLLNSEIPSRSGPLNGVRWA